MRAAVVLLTLAGLIGCAKPAPVVERPTVRPAPATPVPVEVPPQQETDPPRYMQAATSLPVEVLPAVFEEIVWCESEGNPTARNPVSSASGLYQFIDGTWRWVWDDLIGEPPPAPRAYQAPVADQTRAAAALYEVAGTDPWNASRDCWKDR